MQGPGYGGQPSYNGGGPGYPPPQGQGYPPPGGQGVYPPVDQQPGSQMMQPLMTEQAWILLFTF